MSALLESALERWLDKRGLAEHLSCSVRSIETAITRGLPHMFLRIGEDSGERFKASEVRSWLKRNRRRRHWCPNYTAACASCNQSKGVRSALLWMVSR